MFNNAILKPQRITFERVVNGRIHRFTKCAFCRNAFDVAFDIFLRAVRRDIKVDILDLMDQSKTA